MEKQRVKRSKRVKKITFFVDRRIHDYEEISVDLLELRGKCIQGVSVAPDGKTVVSYTEKIKEMNND
jgi:hypothetical protein